MASKNTEEADQPQLAPQPRRDEFGIARCIDTCPHYNAESPFFHPMCELAFEEKEEVTHAVIHSLCEPQARRDAEELQRLREDNPVIRRNALFLTAQWEKAKTGWSRANEENDRLRAESVRLVAIEQRAQKVLDDNPVMSRSVVKRLEATHGGDRFVSSIRYILHGDPAPGRGEREG